MPDWTTACPDWESRIVEGRPLIPFGPLCTSAAGLKELAYARGVFDSLRLVDVLGTPTIAEAGRPWLFQFFEAVFGCYDPDTGRRLIREFFLLISKKNGKSTISAAIMLTALVRNWRQSAEFLILAPTIEIANNSFVPARDMVRTNPSLNAVCKIQEHHRTITNTETGATLKVVAADNETVGGKKATGILVDELWQFGARANAENMLREATGGLASRPEGFVIYLSTQSDKAPAGIFGNKLKYFRSVRDGKIADNRSLPVIYEFPKAYIDRKDYLASENWWITNPNLGSSVDPDFISDQLIKAQSSGEASLCGFAAKHLNLEIGLSLGDGRWAGADHWEACSDKALTLEAIKERSDIIVAGIDGGGLDDLLGLVLLGRDKQTRHWLCWGHAWAHTSVLERRKDISPRLHDFAADGDLTIVANVGNDVAEVCDIIEQLEAEGLLPEKIAVGVDQAGIQEIVDELSVRGIVPERIGGVPQGWKLTNAIKTTERKLAGGAFKHCGSRLMAWCVGNAKVEPRGNAIVITKQVAGSAKIDPLMALFDAVVAMGQNPDSGQSVYEERGLLVF